MLRLSIPLFLLLLALVFPINASNHEVYVLFHEGTSMENIQYMLNDLKYVDGVCVMVNLYGESNEDMEDAINRLTIMLNDLSDYKIIVQAIYVFSDGSFSETFYFQWYSRLANVFHNYPNVVLFVGFNEAYFHFPKEQAKAIMQREYIAWKNVSTIPFSCEITFPFEEWHTYMNVTNPNFENDVLPIWQNYSDYIGLNIQPYTPEGYNLVNQTILTATYYSYLYNKPIHVNEFFLFHKNDVKHAKQTVFQNPHKTAIYKLWDWSNSTENTKALYNINPLSGEITRNPLMWNTYIEVFKNEEHDNYKDLAEDLAIAFIPLIIVFICIGIFKKMRARANFSLFYMLSKY